MIIDIPTVEGGEFIDGGPNTLGTIVRANFLNSLMKSSTATTKEIQTVLSKNDIQPDDRVYDQLFKAISKMVTDKAISVTSTLGDSKELAASQYLANENNKAAKNAQTAANNANDKANQAKQEAYNADQKAVAAQKKADQVPSPIANNFVVGNTTTAYKLMSVEQVKTLLGVPAAAKLYNGTGQATDGAMTQKAVTDAIADSISNIDFSRTAALGAEQKVEGAPGINAGLHLVPGNAVVCRSAWGNNNWVVVFYRPIIRAGR